jgi:uncharacterized SAM-binding protein YcdF (DUF218 family)
MTSSEPNQVAPQARSSRGRLTLRWIEHFLAAGFLVLVVFVVSPSTHWLYMKLDCQDPPRQADYIVCLGGDPYRVLEGVTLLKEGYADKLVLSNFGVATLGMQKQALEWGASGDTILLDTSSHRTADHPAGVEKYAHVDPGRDTCIIVTSFSHMARSKACFEKAGYKHLIMREPRWERRRPAPGEYQHGYWLLTRLLYEYAAWTEYWMMGYI